MPKERNTKPKSKNNKQQSLAEKTEQILLNMPKIIATQIGKDLIILKQHDAKLKGELKKIIDQKKKLTMQFVNLQKKNTPAAKKQYQMTQKQLQKINQLVQAMNRDIQSTQKQGESLSQKRAMYNALQGQLVKFKKGWGKQSNKKQNKKNRVKAKVASQKSFSEKMGEIRHFPQEVQITEMTERAISSSTESIQEPTEEIL